MQQKIKRSYRQAVVETDSHPSLIKGQIVEIVKETDDFYIVQVSKTSNMEKIKKEDIYIN